jgi:hypothetical protein
MEDLMAHPFQDQDPSVNFAFHKSAATPQHGQKADKEKAKIKEPRSFEPRPGH